MSEGMSLSRYGETSASALRGESTSHLTIYLTSARQTPHVLDRTKNQDEHVSGEILQDLYDGFINT